MSPLRPHRQSAAGAEPFEQGFTIVEVMMAATILVVAFVGMIQATVIGSGMMDTARRQTLAAQIIDHEIETLRLHSWTAISALPTAATTLGAAWNSSTVYAVGDTVTSGGAWYRSLSSNSGQTPAAASSFWKSDTPPYASVLSTSGVALAANYTITRTTADIVSGSLREATFRITWVVTTSRRDSGGALLSFTYTRTASAYFGKYGLNLSAQRS